MSKNNKPSKRDDSGSAKRREERAVAKTERELRPGNHTCSYCSYSCSSAEILDIHTQLAH